MKKRITLYALYIAYVTFMLIENHSSYAKINDVMQTPNVNTDIHRELVYMQIAYRYHGHLLSTLC